MSASGQPQEERNIAIVIIVIRHHCYKNHFYIMLSTLEKDLFLVPPSECWSTYPRKFWRKMVWIWWFEGRKKKQAGRQAEKEVWRTQWEEGSRAKSKYYNRAAAAAGESRYHCVCAKLELWQDEMTALCFVSAKYNPSGLRNDDDDDQQYMYQHPTQMSWPLTLYYYSGATCVPY